MTDPLADVVALLQPQARYSKYVIGSGAWRVTRSDVGQPFYFAVLEGGCRLTLDGQPAVEVTAGDFVLVPATFGITMSSLAEPAAGTDSVPVALGDGVFRIGASDGPADLQWIGGHCSFGSPDSALLVSLLPQLIHVRGEPRLAALVRLVRDETRNDLPARDAILPRLLEVLLIEALRSAALMTGSQGLVKGLSDSRLAGALRAMHRAPDRAWSTAELAKEAALSRSVFFDRFRGAMGMEPMEYLLAWRMALARNMLRHEGLTVAEVAERVGYGSASAFSVAFARHVGEPPARYARVAEAYERGGGRVGAAPEAQPEQAVQS